ncbi:hypothetical protein OKW30_007906 [Paraburkholderia sp. Clong3]|uniref:recombinase family protein n=1 Tax=Paraburkholderia sp. Clong3 TaxID=2991061 RepID=UPI003D24F83F
MSDSDRHSQFLKHGLQLPACTPRGEIQWKRPSYGTVYRILTNPIYGGTYAYGKTECAIHYESGEPRKRDRREPRDQWLALIPNAHDGYVDWEEFERIQCTISGNLRLAGHAGAPKNGEALLAGLLRCRRCASRLTLHYTGIVALQGEVSRFGVGLPLLRASEEVHAASTEADADRISTNQVAAPSEARLNGEQIQKDRENVETSARWPWKSGVKS